jgi:threonylcarbamoyladenosine tRNA methylthiotransferase MtaB
MQAESKTVSFYTLGCKLNSYDTEWYREQFEAEGYEVIPFGDSADVTVVNTCTVTGKGDAQSRQMLRKAHRVSPEGTVVAVGCYAQVDPEVLVEMPEVDLVIGTEEKTGIIDLVNDTCSMGRSFVTKGRTANFQDMDIYNFGSRSRAFVKVQEGCNEFCSFCIIPFARGKSRSRSIESTVRQVERLVDAGYREVVLTGVHVGDYGTDLNGEDLIDVLKALEEVEGLERFRVSSIEATFITEEMIEFFSSSRKFCRHLHVPLQSGDDDVLVAMRRPYTRGQYMDLIARLGDRIPDIGIGADVMVGFPGESDRAFQNTYNLIEEVPLVYLHVFPYSPRKGTPAARLPDQIDPTTKKTRGARLRELGGRKADAFRRRYVGETLQVLFEGRREAETGFLQGVSDNYIRVFAPGPDGSRDQIRDTRITGIEGDRAIGEIA